MDSFKKNQLMDEYFLVNLKHFIRPLIFLTFIANDKCKIL